MVILNKNDLQYNILQSDYEIVRDYLKEVEKRSHGAYHNKKHVILECLNQQNRNIKEITMIDINTYLENVIDKKKIKLVSKETYRSYINSFFDYVQGFYLKQDIDFRNPVPNKRVFQFTQKESDIKKQSESNNDIFSRKELIYILENVKKKRLRDFILFSLLIITGARISEIVTIRIENINLEGRYFETGFVKEARKSTRTSKESLLFFFTKNFRHYLEHYIKYLNKKNGWLFPGKSKYYLSHSLRIYVKKNYVHKYQQFHNFRKTLITNRVKLGCPLWVSEGLMNHKSSSIEGEHYIKLLIKDKRELYDKYFPYGDFPYF